MTAPTLYPDQLAARAAIYQAWRTHKRVLQCAPTAFGKGTLATVLLGECASRGKRAVFGAHLEEINNDLVDRVRQGTGIEPRLLMGSHAEGPADSLITIVSEQTVARRGLDLGEVRLFIRDEAHRAASKSHQIVADACKGDTLHLGLTATPERGDGRPLDFYEVLLAGPSPATLAAQGRIAPMVTYAPAKPGRALAQDPVEAWPVGADGRPLPGVLFASSLSHSSTYAERYRAERGFTAVHCEADTPQRDAIVARFNAGEIDILCNRSLFCEGVDLRRSAVTMAAKSFGHAGPMLQACGRSRRMHPSKRRAMFIDLTDNVARLGLPDDERIYSLTGAHGIILDAPPSLPAMRMCRACLCWGRGGRPCDICGEPLPLPPPPKLSKRQLIEQRHARQPLQGDAWETWKDFVLDAHARGKPKGKIAGAWLYGPGKGHPPRYTVDQVLAAEGIAV